MAHPTNFEGQQQSGSVLAPGHRSFDVIAEKHDTNELTYVARYLLIQDAGAVVAVLLGGTTITYTVGTVPFYTKEPVKQIKDTGTTCLNVVGFY